MFILFPLFLFPLLPSSSLPLSLTFSSSLFCFSLSLPLPSLFPPSSPLALSESVDSGVKLKADGSPARGRKGKFLIKKLNFSYQDSICVVCSLLSSYNIDLSPQLCKPLSQLLFVCSFCFNVIIAHHAYQAWIMLIALCVQIIIIYFSINLYACTYFGPKILSTRLSVTCGPGIAGWYIGYVHISPLA